MIFFQKHQLLNVLRAKFLDSEVSGSSREGYLTECNSRPSSKPDLMGKAMRPELKATNASTEWDESAFENLHARVNDFRAIVISL